MNDIIKQKEQALSAWAACVSTARELYTDTRKAYESAYHLLALALEEHTTVEKELCELRHEEEQ